MSELKFTAINGNIRFGLGSVKNVGIAPIEAIIKERNKNGGYVSFTDFCERIADEAVNKKCIESLIKSGAFDEFEQTRHTLLESFEGIIDTIQSSKKKGLEGQFSMFDLGSSDDDENNMNDIKYSFVEKEEFSEKELLSQEKEMLGIYLSGHPLSKLKEEIEKQATISTRDLNVIDNKMNPEDEENISEIELQTQYDNQKALKFKDGQEVRFVGIITSIKKKFTKTNRVMAFVSIEDLYGQAEVIAFENAYLAAKNSLMEENIVLVKGRLSIRDEEKTTIIANEITDFGVHKKRILSINITNLDETIKKKLRGAIKYFNGEMNNIPVEVQEGDSILKCGAIYLTENILKVFEDIVGKENVVIKSED